MSPDTFVQRAALKWRRNTGKSRRLVGEGQINALRLGHLCEEQPEGCYLDPPYSSLQLTRPHETGEQRPTGLSEKAGFHLDLANKAQGGDRVSPSRRPSTTR